VLDELPCVSDSAERVLSPESREEIAESDEREELSEDVPIVPEEESPALPSSAERVSSPVVFVSPRRAVAVSPVPTEFLEVVVLSFALPSPEENEGIETDGIDGDVISGMETDGILTCEKTAPAVKKSNITRLKVRKAFIHHFQPGSQLGYCLFKP